MSFIPIIFENAELVVAEKAPETLSVDSRMGVEEKRPVFSRLLQKQVGLKQIFPVHRLDYEVGGLMIFAKSQESHRLLNTAFESRDVEKQYLAVSASQNLAPEGLQLWESLIVRGKKRSFHAPHGKEARTRAECLESHGHLSFWRLEPLTGRAHQLRLEMATHGFPIVGDLLYGGEPWSPKLAQAGIALQAYTLRFSRKDLCEKLEMPSLFTALSSIHERLKI
jgi:tRNA pseudouridine32 synthase/23S rRNA pseudouridine746 synthase